MEIILSKQCESLTGSLGRGFGYFIVGRWSRKDVKYRYYSQRSRWGVPPNGHLRFIFTCADLAQSKLHVTDIRVSVIELKFALMEAGRYPASLRFTQTEMNASDIINFKNMYNL